MSQSHARRIETRRGRVDLVTYVAPEEIAHLDLDPGIGVYSSYRSILTCTDSLMHQASFPGVNLCLALHEARNIVGYCVRRPPLAGERWASMNPPVLYEVFGENARGWRDLGLMRPMLELVVGDPENEDRILYIVGYSWHWDFDETKKTLMQYRDTIVNLLTPLGFKQYPTNEPNVSLRAENLFMARIGVNIERTVKRRFTNLLFGMSDD